jgi:hypothetical protein
MTGAERAIRWSTVAAVSVVALVAAFVSYRHALQVVAAHGESGALAKAYPLTIDGLIYAASMVLLDAARRSVPAHPLAYVALGLGIAATLAANVAAGLAFGPVGAVVAAWPAPALVISYELLMLVIRGSVAAIDQNGVPELTVSAAVAPSDPIPDTPPAPRPPAIRPGRRTPRSKGAQTPRLDPPEEARVLAWLDGNQTGDKPSIRAVMLARHVGRPTARTLLAEARPTAQVHAILAAGNGHAVEGAGVEH